MGQLNQTLTEYGHEIIAFSIGFRPVSEGCGGPLLLFPFRQSDPLPLDILYPPRRSGTHYSSGIAGVYRRAELDYRYADTYAIERPIRWVELVDQFNRSGSFVRGLPHPYLRVRVRDGGLIFCLMPGCLLVGDTTPTAQVAMVRLDPLIDICRSPVADPHAGARSHCAGAGRWRGAPAGRRPGSRRHASVTRGGVDLTERACRPLIRLSTRRTAAAKAVRVSEPRPSTSSFYLVGCDVIPVPTPDHPRARASPRMRSASGGGGAPGCEEVVSESGREARNKPHTQLTAGGRTLVDADRIKAARIGDPRWRRSNRARLPTADQAIHASDSSSQGSTCERAASLILFSSFFDVFLLLLLLSSFFNLQSGAYAGPPAGARVIAHALSGGWGHRVAEWWLTRAEGGGTAQPRMRQRAGVLLFSLRPSSGSSFQSTRGPPKHRFAIRVIVPTMSG
ncbi:hypothetical protein EVAR_35893_1 [Eumeta japonica]|uniref:Uncharacterized protein n=1 Tax=Eumeta variegata TaxID=151549 RepID=A0A4C1WTM0_EUMVA|nr:hypothetical protein EVAR_35893_1 [Eumeta japonica]